jgi:adenylate cyclase
MRAKLILLGANPPVEYHLGAFATLGRHPDNTIRALDRIVSKEHARVTLGPNGRYVLRDVGSRNGTFVNGERISEHVLRAGDRIGLGSTVFRFEQEDRPVSRRHLSRVTMLPGRVQSEVRSAVDAGSEFVPVAQIRDLETLRADYEKLRVAHALGRKLALHTDLDKLLQQIVDETFGLIRADRAVILLRDPESGRLEPRYVRQRRDEEIRLSSSILAEVVDRRKAVLSSDAMVDERFKLARSVIMQGIRSTMCVPLLVNEELLGVFHMDTGLATGAFSEKDLVLFQGIAAQAAVSIQNHALAKQIEREAATRAQFQRLLSPTLVDEIVSGALDIKQGGTRREVTMLFTDIRGFTAMSERHDPEEMVHTLNAYFEVMVDVLFRHGGTLDKYVGDEIIGLFGAPVEAPDAPLRAVRCALDMMRALDEFNRIRSGTGQEPVFIGIGINTGNVIAGAIGSSQTLQYTVIGDAVNIAARLCGVAGRGEVIISQSTYAACGPHLIVDQRPAVNVKGKSQPLQIFHVTGVHESAPPSAGRGSETQRTTRCGP